MPAPSGNTNAESWTLKRTMDTLNMIEEYADQDHILTLSMALMKVRCYKQLWTYWKKKWAMNADVMDRIYLIEQLFMVKVEHGALFRQMNPSACFFILKHNYGYGNKEASEEVPSYLAHEFETEEDEQSLAPETITEPAADQKQSTTDKPEGAKRNDTGNRNHGQHNHVRGPKQAYRAAAA